MSVSKEFIERRKGELERGGDMDFGIIDEQYNKEFNDSEEMNVTEYVQYKTGIDNVNKQIESNIEELLNISKPVSAKNIKRSHSSGSGVLSVINAKTGMRVTISKEGYEHMGQPQTVQFALTDDELLIGKTLSNNSDEFNVKNYKNKGIIYSSTLVKEITETFKLDYSSRTSITFDNHRFVKGGGDDEVILVVKLK
ncbi:hypothetical protein [Clostridium butyricum]|uniref:hypothetical protein n=1 Tax=Clostridium butyricum TaxID=1492 RepID=UPI00168B3877|nr:hypothetical protein [Clostridium butyricum]MDB2152487.1 hypothetical protein [Clostridium butyricum]